ncbi:MAG: UDP-N-acetylmuramoyl-tripeptide--D-alanyl-D-alanine ligase [Bacilli bacterium]
MNLSLLEIEKSVSGKLFNKNDEIITNITTDSRKIKENTLFIPLKGENFDGHDFISSTYKNGCLCVLSEKRLDINKPYILVKDCYKALLDLAQYYKSLFNITAIGVTGSVGKTTTKEMIASVLETKFNVLKNEANFNNHIGLPLTVFNLNKTHQILINEMGMNHFNEINKLSKVVCPNIAVITNIGTAHIKNLGSRKGILKAKMEILEHIKQEGILIVNSDDDLLCNVNYKNTLFYGINNKSCIRANNIVENEDNISFDLSYDNKDINVVLNTSGIHMVKNALCAALTGFSLGLSKEEIKLGLSNYKNAESRYEIIKLKDFTFIDDSYNASYDSIVASITAFSKRKGTKLCILGDVFEVGNQSKTIHENIGLFLNSVDIDKAIFIGKNSKFAYEKCNLNKEYFDILEQFLTIVDEKVKIFDNVLTKASNGMKFNQIKSHILNTYK